MHLIRLKKLWQLFLGVFLIHVGLFNSSAFADGSFIDKVYHPYVQPHEREIELRWNIQQDSANDDDARLRDNAQSYRLAYGQSINERWFGEVYLVGKNNRQQDFKVSAVELEALWQLTEQGEYQQDWGMLFEVEHEWDNNVSEVSSALLIEQQWQKWVATINLYLIYEWGNSINDEFETALAAQGKYRYSRHLEPAIELYSSDNSKGIGPVLLGDFKLGNRQRIRWEAGVILGLDDKTAEQTYKFIVEYEF